MSSKGSFYIMFLSNCVRGESLATAICVTVVFG